jgi:hypothetical protein
MNHQTTDCRSSEGIAVGLVDGMIAMARVLAEMDLTGSAISEAIKDLQADEDIKKILTP